MAEFWTDDDRLQCGVTLDREHPAVDLTAGGLGDRILDALVLGMLDAHARAQDPDGRPWPPLRPATVKQKGHAVIGIASGRSHLTDPQTYRAGDRDIRAREATWSFPEGEIRDIGHGWQNGNDRNRMPARRLIGWSPAARDRAQRLLAQADFQARE